MRSNRGNPLSTKHTARICPNCGNTANIHFTTGHISPTHGTAGAAMSCGRCGYKWVEYYKLRYDGYDDGYYHYGPDGDAREEGQISTYKTHNQQLDVK